MKIKTQSNSFLSYPQNQEKSHKSILHRGIWYKEFFSLENNEIKIVRLGRIKRLARKLGFYETTHAKTFKMQNLDVKRLNKSSVNTKIINRVKKVAQSNKLITSAVHAPIGIVNSRNNCYMISTIQALVTQPAFREQINTPTLPPIPKRLKNETNQTYQERLNKHNQCCKKYVKGQKILKEFLELYKQPNVTPRQLSSKLEKFKKFVFSENLHSEFKKEEEYRQQDAQVFCNIIFDIIGYSFNQTETKRGIYQRSETSEVEMKQGTNHSIGMIELNVSQNTGNNFQNLIDSYSKEVRCSSDHPLSITDREDVFAPMYELLLTLTDSDNSELPPDVVCFHINRFPIDAKLSLDSEYVNLASLINPKSEEPIQYRIVSYINHHGSTADAGHYTAFTRQEEGWLFCDDAATRPCDWTDVQASKPYIIMLERVK